jgi:hypothetical protein
LLESIFAETGLRWLFTLRDEHTWFAVPPHCDRIVGDPEPMPRFEYPEITSGLRVTRAQSRSLANQVTPQRIRDCERRVCGCLHALLDFAAVATQNDFFHSRRIHSKGPI